MTMTNTTTRDGARPGTLHLPTKTTAPAPMKPIAIPKPLDPNRAVVESNADVSVDLAPEHRKPMPRVKAAQCELAKSLIELTRDVPLEPRDTRQLRLEPDEDEIEEFLRSVPSGREAWARGMLLRGN
ncbi:MAG TPA: hypothetical protein VIF88_03925 [Methylocystis sp.]|jgi:hypothetical protein